jgi:dienelactone hydrolase
VVGQIDLIYGIRDIIHELTFVWANNFIMCKKFGLAVLVAFLLAQTLWAQPLSRFQHKKVNFEGDTVHILIKSELGDEGKAKPLFLFLQGSLPIPLCVFGSQGAYGVFPFKTDSLLKFYHIAIVGKPGVPVAMPEGKLRPDMTYIDSATRQYPKAYSDRNYLGYYVRRNQAVLTHLLKLPMLSKDKLVIAGHSEGSTTAAKLASVDKRVTHVIYAGGNPLGRMNTILARTRQQDDSLGTGAKDEFAYWEAVVADSTSLDASQGDTYRATYSNSIPPITYLMALKIPVLVTYGTKDLATPFLDYLHLETIRKKRTNFTYHTYVGLDHNFFGILPNGQPNYSDFNWDKVAFGWARWLAGKK